MAQAKSFDTRSAFLAQLLAPITAPAKTPAARQFLNELHAEAERLWSIAYHRYHAAQAHSSYCSHARRAAELERRTRDVPEAAAVAQAHLAMLAAVDQMMHVPAPTIGALREKQKMRGFSGGRRRWDEAIARDEAALVEKVR